MTIRLLLLFLVAGGSLFAQPDWRVGLASVKITPEEPIPMAGYASRRAPFESVDADLYAKALALEDRGGARALLITADLLGFPSEVAERICERIKAATGMPREDILLNGSHTHSGPLVAGSALSGVAPEMRPRIAEYISKLEDKVVAIAERALGEMEPAALGWGTGVAKFVMNRREFTPRGVILGTNPRGLADRTVPVLRVTSTAGDVRAVVFGAASHCTTLTGGNMLISGDYAGYAQAFLEARRPGVQAMFVTGCAGDTNPFPRGTIDLARRHGSELAEEVVRVLGGELLTVRGSLRTEFRRVELPLQKLSRSEIEEMAKGAPSYRRFFTNAALEILNRGGKLRETYTAPLAMWRIGDELTLVAYSGETLGDYALNSERILGPLNLWVSGYNNDLFGYLPPARVLEEGGYETRGLYADYGLFTPEVERVVLGAIEEMGRAIGRIGQ